MGPLVPVLPKTGIQLDLQLLRVRLDVVLPEHKDVGGLMLLCILK